MNTIMERVQKDISDLRRGATLTTAVVLLPEAANRVADLLEELLKDCTKLEESNNWLVDCARKLREAQGEYMAAREERGGKDRVYDDSLQSLGRAVAIAGVVLDDAIKNAAAE